ncbi:MAG: hypothetical protein PHF63_00895 [Herbinix sp.]|nr:hypothetical protein [Herbinix sp.]
MKDIIKVHKKKISQRVTIKDIEPFFNDKMIYTVPKKVEDYFIKLRKELPLADVLFNKALSVALFNCTNNTCYVLTCNPELESDIERCVKINISELIDTYTSRISPDEIESFEKMICSANVLLINKKDWSHLLK